MCLFKHEWKFIAEVTISHAKGNWPRGWHYEFPARLDYCPSCKRNRIVFNGMPAVDLEEVELVVNE